MKKIMILILICLMCGCQKVPLGHKISQQKLLDVPYINQVGVYPTGCESVSATMLLNYHNIDISVKEFIDNYLEKGHNLYEDNGELVGASPWKKFIGNPYETTGYGCYSPVIMNALNQIVDSKQYRVEDLSFKTLQDICQNYIDQDLPVLIWATIDMKPPAEGRTWRIEGSYDYFTWIKPEHCLVLTGYDENYYYFNDPLQCQNMAYPKEDVEKAYQGLFQQALTIVPL